jgi:hypothetical protein
MTLVLEGKDALHKLGEAPIRSRGAEHEHPGGQAMVQIEAPPRAISPLGAGE